MGMSLNDYDILEYVQSNGNQYVKTTIKPESFGRIEMCAAITDTSKLSTLWCARGATTTTNTLTAFYINGSGVRGDYYSTTGQTSNTIKQDVPFIACQDEQLIRINGSIGYTHTPYSFTAGNYLTFFNCYYNGLDANNNHPSYMKFYWCRVYSAQNKLMAFFVPVKQKSSSKIGLYDTVNNVFYQSTTGTSLVAGSVKGITVSSNLQGDNLVYQECEYIQSTGVQYINLGLKPTSTMKLELDEQYTVLTNNTLSGSMDNNNGYRFHIGMYGNAFCPGIYSAYLTTPTWNTNRHVVSIDASTRKMVLDGTSYSLSSTGSSLPSYAIYISARNDNGTASTFINGHRIYGLKLYSGSSLVLDCIPVYNKYSGMCGLYNKQNGGFYSYSGSANYLCAPKTDLPIDVVTYNSTKLTSATYNSTTVWKSKYRPLAYIQSTGAQYINLGLKPTSTMKLELDEQYTSLSGSMINGAYDTSNGYRFHIGFWSSAFHPGLYNGYLATPSWNTNRNKVILDAQNKQMQLNGTNYAVSTSSTSLPSYYIYISARNDSGTASNYTNTQKIFKVTIWYSSSILFCYIPVLRLSDNKPGLLEVNYGGTFYTTATSTDYSYAEQ